MPTSVVRRAVLVSASAVAVAGAILAGTLAHAEPDAPKRMVFIAVDGFDWNRAESMMADGKLPALAALRARGGASRLIPSNPAQSPVSWATIATGGNPGKTGIYDFLRRRKHDPSLIEIGLVGRGEAEPVPTWLRVALIAAAGVLGAVAGGALMFAAGTVRRSIRTGKRMEIALTCGAAVFASAAFVALRWVPEKVPAAENLRSGEPFWVTLDRAGVRTVALEAPLSFPPDEMTNGCCLAGLGVPDMAGTWGVFSLWSDDVALTAETETAGRTYFVPPESQEFDLVVGGPPNPFLTPAQSGAIDAEAKRESYLRGTSFDWTRARRRESETKEALVRLRSQLSATLRVSVRRGEGCTVRLQDGTTADLAPGRWSELLPITFRASPITTLHGRVRLVLDDAGGPKRPFRLFVGQVQWDLTDVPPNVALTSPRSFAAELGKLGPAENIGWPEQTNPVKDRLLSDQAFVDHTNLVLALRERRFRAELAKPDWRCLFVMFCEPDRVQHAFYRHVDPAHALHDPEAAKRFGPEIERSYREIDRIVGETVRAVGPDTAVLVVSDHGFAPFRRGVNLNNFLVAHGYQTREGNSGPESVAALVGGGRFFRDVDWTRTKAYTMGLGNGYVNVAGREPGGIVPIDQVDAVVDAIAKDLEALRDADGARVVRKVYRGRDLYSGPRVADAPDFVIGFEKGYRVSWQATLGALDADVITPNTQPWSGDHCSVDPEYVPAALFSSVPLRTEGTPRVEDVAPAVLSYFGVEPKDADGKSFLAK